MAFKLTPKVLLLILGVLFALSRFYIFANPPPYYSDVKADYERYANMWRYGLTPYRKHLYEYPPATIPLLSFPLTLDQAGIGKYYQNYRTQILVVDVIFFVYLVFISRKIPWMKTRWFESLLVYIVMTTLAKDFFYEGIDLAFSACTLTAFTLPFAFKKQTFFSQLLGWVFFWLSTAIKFLTFPLVIPFFLLQKTKNWKRDVLLAALGCFLVWGVPVALYRSSLMVSFTYNNNRPVKYASFPAHLIRWINSVTGSETQKKVAPDFPYEGPVSSVVTKADAVVFPVALGALVLFTIFTTVVQQYGSLPLSVTALKNYLFKNKTLELSHQLALNLGFYLLFVFVLFLTAKIFSQPFHIWYMAAIILFPFQDKKTWYQVIGLCLLMILLDMTSYLHVPGDFYLSKNLPAEVVRDVFRFIPMFVMIGVLLKEFKNNHRLTKQE